MRVKENNTTMFFLLASIILCGCKADVSGDSRIYDPLVFGTSYVQIHKTGSYPDSATLKVNGYLDQVSNSTTVEIDSSFRSLMPFSDTSFSRSILLGNMPDRKHYYTWKIVGPGGDSLLGGTTRVQTIPVNSALKAFTFDVNF